MTAQITVKGIVGMNPELKEFDNNKKARFTVASNSLKKGEQITTWYTVEAWNGNTDIVMERIKKGQLVEVTGRLRLSLYLSEKHNENRLDANVSLENVRILPKESQPELVVEVLTA